MPTADRRQFVPQAIRCFLEQDWPDKELIVVDDGADPVANLIPVDPGIRYFRNAGKRTIGAKRNFGCQQAGGELIVHWDDDDWSAPWRIRYQVTGLLEAKADICGLDHVLFYAPGERRSWEFVYSTAQRPWVYGASLCYTRKFWESHRFPEIQVGEDARFVRADARAKIIALSDPRFLVAMVHGRNTSPKRTNDPRYRHKPAAEVEALLGDHVEFYRRLGTAKPQSATAAAVDPRPARPLPPAQRARTAVQRTALITASRGIGDILRVTPLIRVARQLGYEVDVLLETDYAEVADLLAGAPEIRRLFQTPSARRAGADNRDAPDSEGLRTESLRGLKGADYDLATFTCWSARLRSAVRAKRTYQFERARWLTEGDGRSVERLARQLGWKGALPPPFAVHSQRRFDLPPGTVAIHPGCKYEWPWKKWHGFDALARQFANVVIIGSEEDQRTDNTYFRRPFDWPAHARNFMGELSLADTAALLKECAVLVANDSGLMHLGIALGVPTFGIFGITNPDREATGAANFHAITKRLPCEAACRRQPWGRRDCDQHLECLKMLTTEEVFMKICERCPEIIMAPRLRAADKETEPAITRTLERHRPVETVSIAAEITGGVGDALIASALLRDLHSELPESLIHVFCHSEQAAAFVFHEARFVKSVQPASRLAPTPERWDLLLRIHCSLLKCDLRNEAKLRRVNPGFADRLMQGMARFETYRGLFEQHPACDGLWGRISVRNSHDRRTSLGWLSGVSMSHETPLFMSPDAGEYAFFEQGFPYGSARFVTVHDGFDNNVRLPAGAATKCWPLEFWARLVQCFKKARPEIAIVQLGNRNSRPIPGVDCGLLNQTSLHQAAWILKHARIHIDGDSGLVHLARAMHTPSVVLFGPTDPQFFGYGQNENLTSGSCGNCWWTTPTWLSRCPRGLASPECMAAIRPEHVCEAALRLAATRADHSFRVVGKALYGQPDFADRKEILSDVFGAARIPRVPITQHGRNPETGLYLHASKQWEYLFAWTHLKERFGSQAAGLRIADLGGGRSAWGPFLASRGAGIDLFDKDYLWDSDGDLAVESRFFHTARDLGCHPFLGSFFNLPVEDSTYDIVTSISVVEHLRHKRYALQEALRILKPGGMLVVTFDISLAPDRHQDALRPEILSPSSLDALLAHSGIASTSFEREAMELSVKTIQQDCVLGIPRGMTVGGVVITKD